MTDRVIGVHHISSKDAKTAADLFKTITASRGRLNTLELKEEIVERSRPKDSPTHHLFDWNDRTAAHALRLYRAEEIIRSVYVIFEEAPEQAPVRAFPVVTCDGKRGPYPIRSVLQSRDMTAAMIENAKADLVSWTSRYERLSKLAELREVFAIVEKVTSKKRKTG